MVTVLSGFATTRVHAVGVESTGDRKNQGRKYGVTSFFFNRFFTSRLGVVDLYSYFFGSIRNQRHKFQALAAGLKAMSQCRPGR